MTSKLPEEVIRDTPDIPWDAVRGMRIVVDHVYHAVDYRIVWQTLQDDVPKLGLAMEHWRDFSTRRSASRWKVPRSVF